MAVIKITHETKPAAAPDVIHYGARRLLVVAMLAHPATPEQAVGVQVLALVAQILIHVRVGDGPVNGRRVRARPSKGQNGQLPIPHMQTDPDGRAELVLIA